MRRTQQKPSLDAKTTTLNTARRICPCRPMLRCAAVVGLASLHQARPRYLTDRHGLVGAPCGADSRWRASRRGYGRSGGFQSSTGKWAVGQCAGQVKGLKSRLDARAIAAKIL